MAENTARIGETLRRIRKDMKISLDQAAQLTGVSKAMLGQIERGESNPTISTLWKISAGLKVSMSTFVSSTDSRRDLISLDEITPVEEEDGKMLLFNIFPFDPISGFDYLEIRLAPGCRHVSEGHANVMNEYLMVRSGELSLTVNEEVFRLGPGQAISFPGNSYHVYMNPGEKETVFSNIMRYI
ncbi:MAG: helix-turn-helix domain-containing protein [Anaerovoracaceae bacterium]|jgi:transcriptional regulator with XRE-family HTH domain